MRIEYIVDPATGESLPYYVDDAGNFLGSINDPGASYDAEYVSGLGAEELLQLSVGLNPLGLDLSDPSIAAALDVNKDGRFSSADALETLKADPVAVAAADPLSYDNVLADLMSKANFSPNMKGSERNELEDQIKREASLISGTANKSGMKGSEVNEVLQQETTARFAYLNPEEYAAQVRSAEKDNSNPFGGVEGIDYDTVYDPVTNSSQRVYRGQAENRALAAQMKEDSTGFLDDLSTLGSQISGGVSAIFSDMKDDFAYLASGDAFRDVKDDLISSYDSIVDGSAFTGKDTATSTAAPAQTFGEAFNAAFQEQGEGGVFTYNGKQYTTDLAPSGTSALEGSESFSTGMADDAAAAVATGTDQGAFSTGMAGDAAASVATGIDQGAFSTGMADDGSAAVATGGLSAAEILNNQSNTIQPLKITDLEPGTGTEADIIRVAMAQAEANGFDVDTPEGQMEVDRILDQSDVTTLEDANYDLQDAIGDGTLDTFEADGIRKMINPGSGNLTNNEINALLPGYGTEPLGLKEQYDAIRAANPDMPLSDIAKGLGYSSVAGFQNELALRAQGSGKMADDALDVLASLDIIPTANTTINPEYEANVKALSGLSGLDLYEAEQYALANNLSLKDVLNPTISSEGETIAMTLQDYDSQYDTVEDAMKPIAKYLNDKSNGNFMKQPESYRQAVYNGMPDPDNVGFTMDGRRITDPSLWQADTAIQELGGLGLDVGLLVLNPIIGVGLSLQQNTAEAGQAGKEEVMTAFDNARSQDLQAFTSGTGMASGLALMSDAEFEEFKQKAGDSAFYPTGLTGGVVDTVTAALAAKAPKSLVNAIPGVLGRVGTLLGSEFVSGMGEQASVNAAIISAMKAEGLNPADYDADLLNGVFVAGWSEMFGAGAGAAATALPSFVGGTSGKTNDIASTDQSVVVRNETGATMLGAANNATASETLLTGDPGLGGDNFTASENLMANSMADALATANVTYDNFGDNVVLTNQSTGMTVTVPKSTPITSDVIAAVKSNDETQVTNLIKNAKITDIDLTRTDDDTITTASELTGIDSDKMAAVASNAGKTFTLDETGGVVKKNTGNAELTIGGVSIDSLKALGLSLDLDGAKTFNDNLADGSLTAADLQNALTEMNNKEANTIETVDTTDVMRLGDDNKMYQNNALFTGKHPDTGIEYVNGVKKDTSGIAGLGSEEQYELNLTGGTGTQLTDVGNTSGLGGIPASGSSQLDALLAEGNAKTNNTGIASTLTQEQLNAITGKTDLDVNALTTSQADVVTGTDVNTNQTTSVTNAQTNSDGTITGTDVVTGNTVTVSPKANTTFDQFGNLVKKDINQTITVDPNQTVDPVITTDPIVDPTVDPTVDPNQTVDQLPFVEDIEQPDPVLPVSNFTAPTGQASFLPVNQLDPNQVLEQQTNSLLVNAFGGGLASFGGYGGVNSGYSAYGTMPTVRGPGSYGFAGTQNFRTAPQSYGGGYDPSTLTSNLQQAPMASEDLLSQEASFNR